jgi:hypothetical protein
LFMPDVALALGLTKNEAVSASGLKADRCCGNALERPRLHRLLLEDETVDLNQWPTGDKGQKARKKCIECDHCGPLLWFLAPFPKGRGRFSA